MSAVYVRLNYRLGNCMFQYITARLLADELGYDLYVISNPYGVRLSDFFLGASLRLVRNGKAHSESFLKLVNLAFERCEKVSRKIRIELPFPFIAQRATEKTGWPDIGPIDIKRASQMAKGRPLFLDGYFESFSHLEPYSKEIRKIFYRPVTKKERIIVHMRLGDVAGFIGNGEEYIHEASRQVELLLKEQTLPVVILTEEKNHPLTDSMKSSIERIAGQSVEILGPESVFDAFDELLGSRYQIITNSTWTWWAGFLSGPECKVFPIISEYQPIPWRNYSLFHSTVPENFNVLYASAPSELRTQNLKTFSAVLEARQSRSKRLPYLL